MVSLGLFAAGVLLAAVTAACAYFSNSLYAAYHADTVDDWAHPYVIKLTGLGLGGNGHVGQIGIAVIAAMLAVVLFMGGVIVAGEGIWNLVSLSATKGA